MLATSEAPAGLNVRRGRRGDLAALKGIWLAMMRAHAESDAAFALADDCVQRWEEITLDLLSRPDAFVLVGVRDLDVLGFCLGWVARNPTIYARSEVGFLSELAVAQSARRRGIGRSLMAAAKAWFRARAVTEFQLSTAVWNHPAQALWQAAGGEPLLVRYRFSC